ncbi:hypothetical protein V491_08988 [Pseudogymnoascus sp. VKM F-3775]|nr:hypothetical protein V491_08988 [Pseudogymnoascus sp. VKM F-3775]
MAIENKSLILTTRPEQLSLQTAPIPFATPGSVIIHVLGTYILPFNRAVFTNQLPYPLSLPIIPGNAYIARVHAVGPDAVTLAPGQLVFGDITISRRDDPDVQILQGLNGGFSLASMKLMEGEWRNSTFAEYGKLPLEIVFPLDEELLLGKLGYSIPDLCWLPAYLVPFGGLADIDVKVGEMVIVAPAIGRFGGGAVTIALAMGARVIACGRSKETLLKMAETFQRTGRIEIVILSGDVEIDMKAMIGVYGVSGADVFIDFSPGVAKGSTHMTAAIGALRRGGRCCFMGGIIGPVEVDYGLIIWKNLRIQGRFIYEREHVVRLVKMLETSTLKLGKAAGVEIEEALEVAEKHGKWGKQVVLMP